MINFKNYESVLSGVKNIFKFKNTKAPDIPTPLILIGAQKKQGLSAEKIASSIIKRKSEAGLNIGTLPSGETSPDEIMIRIMVEEIIKAMHEDMGVIVGIPAGQTINAAGISPSGPVTVVGATTTIFKAYGQVI